MGSSFGLILRFFIKNNFTQHLGFGLNNISLVNILASLFLGILVAINPINKNLFFLLSVGFLGCFSTFSSFIYRLFNLIQRKQYLRLLIYYIEVVILSFLFFYSGYFIILFFKN